MPITKGDPFNNINGDVIMANFPGTTGDDTINGSGKADVITGLAGHDWINAGNGDDNVDGGAGKDTIYGGSGNDSLLGGGNDDWIDGGSQNDTILGGAGDDTLDGGSQDDSVSGGNGNDSILGGSSNDTLDGGDDNDSVWGGSGNDSMLGGNGNDWLDGESANDNINGGEGNDHLLGGAGSDVLVGDSGNPLDNPSVVTGPNLIVNGSFETPDVAAGNYGLYNTIDGWYSLNIYKIEIQDNIPGIGAASDGAQLAELDSDGNSILAQDVTTEAGQYELSFDFKSRPGLSDGQGAEIFFDGANVGSVAGSADWTTHTFVVNADGSGSAQLAFASLGTQNGQGNLLDNVKLTKLTGTANDTIESGTGNDQMTGGAGSDLFVFRAADNVDTVTDFTHGMDKIELNGFGIDFANVQSHTTQVGADTHINLAAGSEIILKNVLATSLTASDFSFT